MSTTNKNSSSSDDAKPAAAALPNPPPRPWSSDGGGKQSPTPHRMHTRSKKLQPNQDPPPPEGGGATNPPPPDEHNFTQSDGSPSLLTPSSLSHEGAEPTDFITVTAACGLRTTPPHDEILCPTVPSPTTTKNSFAALAPPDSPPAIPDSTIVRTADDPRPAIATTPPHHNSSSRFLASFYATWPESEVFDDSSRRIWDILHLSFAQADLVYEALDDRQSSMQTTFDARQASLQRSTKLTFDTSNPMFIVAPAKLRMPLQWRCNVSTRLMPPSSLRSRA